jgi:hypothetical protein
MRLLFILMLSSLAFAQLAEPPLDSVAGNNSERAAALEGWYNSSYAQNGSLVVHFGDYSQMLNLSASIEIAGLSPTIDNMSCASEGLSLIVARGFEQGHLTSLPSSGYPDFTCDRNFFLFGQPDFAWRCDFDNDNCVEYENQSSVAYDMNVTFIFGNESESVPFGSTLIPVPEDTMDRLRSASGMDNLTVVLSGDVVFSYQIDNRSFDFGDCGSNASTAIQRIPFSLNRTFIIGGEKKLFYLRSPVLREQWFRNGRFDMVVLSQCPLYRAGIYRNGNLSDNISMKEFYVGTDDFGLQYVGSNASEGAGWSESRNITTPTPLEGENDSFAFIYEFNHTYSGLGEDNFSITVEDEAGNSSGYADSLMSRMLSYEGKATESGSPAGIVPARPSAEFHKDDLTPVQIGLGLVAFVIFLAFVNFWVL